MLTDIIQLQTHAGQKSKLHLQQITPVQKQLRSNSKLSMGKANTIKL